MGGGGGAERERERERGTKTEARRKGAGGEGRQNLRAAPGMLFAGKGTERDRALVLWRLWRRGGRGDTGGSRKEQTKKKKKEKKIAFTVSFLSPTSVVLQQHSTYFHRLATWHVTTHTSVCSCPSFGDFICSSFFFLGGGGGVVVVVLFCVSRSLSPYASACALGACSVCVRLI